MKQTTTALAILLIASLVYAEPQHMTSIDEYLPEDCPTDGSVDLSEQVNKALSECRAVYFPGSNDPEHPRIYALRGRIIVQKGAVVEFGPNTLVRGLAPPSQFPVFLLLDGATISGAVIDGNKYNMWPALRELSESSRFNRIIEGSGEIGIITSGVASQYAREIMPDVHFLILGMTFPIPDELIRKFAATVNKIYVIEELEPYLEEQIRALGIEVVGKDVFPRCGELNPELVRSGLTGEKPSPTRVPEDIPMRPPVMCPGCPHRGFFHTVKKNKLYVTGDIGCYTLSVLPPLAIMDTCICMGASISGAVGFAKAFEDQPGKKVVAVLGDSTFMHSGLTGLMDTVYNKANVITCILDNRTTAMTGRQDHPGTGFTIKGEPTHRVDIAEVAKALGVKHVYEVDPYNLEETDKALKDCLGTDESSVMVVKRACALKVRDAEYALSVIDQDACNKCGECLKVGCPAIIKKNDVIMIDRGMCFGCGICRQVCTFDAIAAIECEA